MRLVEPPRERELLLVAIPMVQQPGQLVVTPTVRQSKYSGLQVANPTDLQLQEKAARTGLPCSEVRTGPERDSRRQD